MKNKWTITLLSLMALGASGQAFGDKDSYMLDSWASEPKKGVAPVDNKTYLQECGACHFPYQPGLLPAQSWEKIMAGLNDHFGDNAELSSADTATIRNYLLDNAAGRVHYRLSKKLVNSLGETVAPMRISEIPYFIKEHREIPARMVADNPKVRSFSHCNACHTRAAEGSYRENEISIPGFGRWED